MCGIIGYCGPPDSAKALPQVLEGLRRLEYRGYDSSGVAILDSAGKLAVHKSAGKVAGLVATIPTDVRGAVGIGHTRWATHGRATDQNAHPHVDCTGAIAIVHNGIVENYRELKSRLTAQGHQFRSDTDTEVIVHLIEELLRDGKPLEEAVRLAARQLAGSQAIAVLSQQHPATLIGVRVGHAGGLVVGYGSDAMHLASDLPALIGDARQASYLESREMAVVTPSEARFMDLEGNRIQKTPQPVLADPVAAAKGPYRHFMLKEIMEQPETLVASLSDRIDFQRMRVSLPDIPWDMSRAKKISRVLVLGMGTSFHAAQVGRFMFEPVARLPAEAENASEFRYRDAVIDPSTLAVSVTQSGETVDTLVSMAEARRRGAPQVAVCNVPGSEATRVADYSLLLHAGPEIAVASTKTLMGSMACLLLLAITLGDLRGTLTAQKQRRLVEEMARLPRLVGDLVQASAEYEAIARRYAQHEHFLVLGRGIGYPMAMEGALKLKEISYAHAEGYAAGEMKHGPIALIDEKMPVIVLALKDRLYDKMMSNIDQVRARDGRVIAIATQGDEAIREKAHHVLYVPEVPELLSPFVALAPLQLLAYHIAVRRGCDVDQPRNLAKTVTVE